MSKLIKDLPKWVQEIVFERRIEYGEQPDYDIFICEAFLFEDTKEGLDIWQETNEGNYQPLADFHGIAIDENGNQTTPTTKDPAGGYGGC